jgi:hypothetical protein
MITRKSFGSKYVNIPANNIAAEEHLPEAECLLEGQTVNKEESLISRAGTQLPTVFKR